jgi:hypothetical protein
MWVASVVLPTPPFWLSSATIMAWTSLLENLAVAAGFRGSRSPVGWLYTETRRCYYQLENLS